MDVHIKMPDLATTAEEVTILRWLVEIGAAVRLGQPLLEIETDKASMDVEAVAAGTLKAILAKAGDQVAVGQVIAVIEDLTTAPGAPSPQHESILSAAPTTSPDNPIDTPFTPNKAAAKTSLFARNKRAREGAATGPTLANEILLNATQRELARRLQESKQTVPHFYLNTSANAEPMIARRTEAQQGASPRKLLWDAFFVAAVAQAIKDYERMRYRFEGDRLVRRLTDAIGVAADVDDNLYVIPVENPLALSVAQISEQIATRAEHIRQGDPAAKKLAETCLTITNLGAENIDSFQAIINPPESAILAIGKVAPSVQPSGDPVNPILIQQRVTLSLSVDHRIANGKYAAKFLSRIVQVIETL